MTPFSLDSLNPAHIETYQRKAEGAPTFDWRLVAGNGEVICSSLHGFTSRGDADRAAQRAMDLMAAVPEIRSV